jgi:ribonuclease P protein component
MPARPPRLKQRREFQRVAGKGLRAARPGLVLQALPAPGQPVRVGFTATKKLGNAVARNRAKRRLREAARLMLGAGQAEGFDLVLICREATGDRAWPTLLGDLRGALKQAGVVDLPKLAEPAKVLSSQAGAAQI